MTGERCYVDYFDQKGCFWDGYLGEAIVAAVTKGQHIKSVWVSSACEKATLIDDDPGNVIEGYRQDCVITNIANIGNGEPTVSGPCKYIWLTDHVKKKGVCIELKSDLQDDVLGILTLSIGRGVMDIETGVRAEAAASGPCTDRFNSQYDPPHGRFRRAEAAARAEAATSPPCVGENLNGEYDPPHGRWRRAEAAARGPWTDPNNSHYDPNYGRDEEDASRGEMETAAVIDHPILWGAGTIVVLSCGVMVFAIFRKKTFGGITSEYTRVSV